MPAITNDHVAEILVVLIAVSDYLRAIDESVPAFALRGVADALTRSIEPAQTNE